jgi:hypothetical protein
MQRVGLLVMNTSLAYILSMSPPASNTPQIILKTIAATCTICIAVAAVEPAAEDVSFQRL